jgi:steroid 5-alpha reductase family enzyme
MIHSSRPASFVSILVIYVLALATAFFTFRVFAGMHILLATFLADVAATLLVWLAGVLLGNSSVYDPYWSVAPVPVVLFWAWALSPLKLAGILCLAALLVWGARLTANWARRWGGLAHQDWRYTMYRQNMPRLWFFVNLFGISLMPTVLVYLAMIPVYYAISASGAANVLTVADMALCVVAVLLEHFADIQMDAYKKRETPKSPCIEEGLWLVCRHPNYLGEVLFWWGLWLMQESVFPAVWTVAGPVFITLLFVFVSIPMMEKHVLETRPEYELVMKRVPMILPALRIPGKRPA